MLTMQVVALTESDVPSRKEVLDLSNELDKFKQKTADFNSFTAADSAVIELHDLDVAFGPFQERAMKFKAVALA